MHPEFEKLPHFRILEVEHKDPADYRGLFDCTLRLGEGWHGYLVNESDAAAKGRFFSFHSAKRTSVFRPLASTETSSLKVGRSYTYVDGYWGERVELVLDTSESWSRTQFVPRLYQLGRRFLSLPAGQAPPSPDWVLATWDHEHCEICCETIGQLAQPFGYESNTGKWVCEKCYSDYVEPRSVSFIDDLAISQIRGDRQS